MSPNPLHWTERAAVTVAEAAHILSISNNAARYQVSTGRIPTITLGRRLLVPVAWLRQQLEHEAVTS